MGFIRTLLLRSMLVIGLMGLSAGTQALDMQYLPEIQTVDLMPRMRPEPLTASLYTISTDTILKYLENLLIFEDMDHYETLPYVVGFDRNAKMGGTGDTAYTKGLFIRNDVSEFSFLAPGNMLEHPVTGEKLGLEVFVIGNGIVKEFGVTQSILISHCETSVEINTRLTPLVGLTLPAVLEVKYPPKSMHGYIVSIPDLRNLAAVYSVVAVSLGRRDGLKQGHVLDIVEGIREVIDPNEITDPRQDKEVILPSTKVGEVLIFNVKEKISLGLITYSKRPIILIDELAVPNAGD